MRVDTRAWRPWCGDELCVTIFFWTHSTFWIIQVTQKLHSKMHATPSLYRHAGPACSIQSRDCKDNVLEVKTRPRSNFLNYYHYPFESAPSSVIPLFLPPPNVRGQKSLREQELSQKTFWRRVKAISGFCIPLSRDYNRVLVPLDKNWWDDQLESLCKCTCIYEKFNPHIFVNFSAWHCVNSHS